ncbi:conserved unknown protein [Ectocarpus siliculosus]|uniref:mitogen-activated protein kinase kinase n=1 Tax=Ectocarpus siliculosus TaxID=2880 RepID=D7FHW3_ECTSI|nr:conserved unknown protein [Ectocarpus siliculosus]|eukprot:CBJ48974.1 conserved unknown protein [Ectocarpus siliculosus]
MALDFVHSCGRVHRDVKPANLLITRNGDLKLGDFGAAGVENSSRMVGTQRFMAPERLKGHRATAQSDLWSLGLSLATAAFGDDFISQGSNQFVQLDMACRVRRRLSKTTTLSAELMDFLHSCLSRDPARRPALRDLMKHPFLSQRQNWQAKCPEVALAMQDRKRLQSGDVSAIEEVLDALCHVRAEENLIGTSFDPATAADLAYELGVTTDSLVRDVHRRTLEFIRERGGGSGSGSGSSGSLSSSGGVSDSGDENGDEMRSRDSDGGEDRWRTISGGGGGGIAGDEARRRRRRPAARDDAGGDGGGETREERPVHRGGEGRREESCSPRPEPPPQAAAAAAADALTLAMDMIPTATREGDGSIPRSGGNNAYPLVTPRDRPTRGGATGGAGFGGRHSTVVSSNTRSRRRALEMSPAVKLTPHKRRGERKASQTKRNGSSCVANGTRRAGRGREKEREATAAAAGTEPETSISGSPQEQATEVVTAAAETAVEGLYARVTGTDRDHQRFREAGAATVAGPGAGHVGAAAAAAAGVASAGITAADGLPSCRDNLVHTAACRRSWERKCKRNSRPRTASSRTLPSRADVRTRSMRGVFQLADEMKAQIAVRDRVHRLRVYPRCFSGREAVQWMLDGCHASSVMEAENIGNEMMKASVFQHILNSHVFEDSSVYYQFTDGDTPPPPSRGSRRLRQIARVVGGHVARRLVPSGGGAGGIGAADCICPVAPGNGSGLANQHQASRPGDRGSKVKRRSRGRGSQSVLQLRRFSSSMSTLTVPETPY